jgi:hypothetical protein
MSLPVDSEWRIERESAHTETIKVTTSSGPRFSAVYLEIDPPNTSEFTGEVRTREATVLSLRQHFDGNPQYTAFHVGSRQGERDEYVGAWHDVAHGHSGRFRLVRTR